MNLIQKWSLGSPLTQPLSVPVLSAFEPVPGLGPGLCRAADRLVSDFEASLHSSGFWVTLEATHWSAVSSLWTRLWSSQAQSWTEQQASEVWAWLSLII